MAAKPKILIAGAGMGGLTAGAALLQAGYDVEIYEQAPKLGEVGAGFQVSANATRVLYALGLGDGLERAAAIPEGKVIRIWSTGDTWPLFDFDQAFVERYGYPYYTFHRADLHELLVDAVRREKSDAIYLGHACTGFEQDGDGVTLKFDNGNEARGDALIGADGVHSTIRAALGHQDNPVFTGSMAWRGVLPADDLPEDRFPSVGTNWVGPGGHCITYHLRRGEIFNFVGVREKDWQVESWTTRGSREEFVADFGGWHEDIHYLIERIEEPFKWAFMVRDPLERWTSGRVTLLGDACHAMVPMLAQGACAAIEDGYVLMRAFEAAGNAVEEALGRYEGARHERTSRMVLGSADNARRFHDHTLADPSEAKEYVDREWQPERIFERYDWLFNYDATTAPV